jgi:hypothetical protein
MTYEHADPEADPKTPDTCFLEFSPRTTARLRGDFARLIPINLSAMLAFDDIARTLKLDPEWNPHARQFIHVDDLQDLPPQWQDSDTETDVKDKPKKIWTGCYRFSLELLPRTLRLGWVLGGGRKDMKDQGVDLLLTLEKTKHHIHGRHARLTHDLESSAFMLYVAEGKVVIVNGKERLEGSQRAISSVETGLSLGDLAYQLEFTQLNEMRYREQLGKLRVMLNRGDRGPPLSLEVTPSENHFEYHGFTIQTPFASGGHGVISAGIKKTTGKAVAVKRLKRTPESVARIFLEVEIYKKIGDHVSLIKPKQYLSY